MSSDMSTYEIKPGPFDMKVTVVAVYRRDDTVWISVQCGVLGDQQVRTTSTDMRLVEPGQSVRIVGAIIQHGEFLIIDAATVTPVAKAA